MLPAEKLECPHLTVLSFLLDPCPVSIYIIAIRCTGIGKHLSTVTAVIPYVIPLYPASYHIAGCIKEVPVIVDILPLVYRIAAVRVAVPPADVIFKPCALTSVCVSRAAVIIYELEGVFPEDFPLSRISFASLEETLNSSDSSQSPLLEVL